MGTTEHKPVKVKLNNKTASGMYILISNDEIRYTKENETKPPNRNYKIEVAVEVMYNHKRARGKETFNIRKGTSIAKAVRSLLGKREDMKNTLKSKGTLKVEKKIISKIDTKDRKFKSIYAAWIARKQIEVSVSTVRMYNGSYNVWIKKLDNKIIDEITEDDIQNLINEMIGKGKKPKTITIVKAVLKPLLDTNDVILNWKKIILPKIEAKEKFSGDDAKAKLIAKTLLEYKHPIARGVFTFLLTGRRINETMLMEYSHLNYKRTEQYPYGSFTLPKENTKTNTEVTYALTPLLLDAIKIQKTTKGKIFDLKAISVHYHWRLAIESIGVTNMVMHDLRSMVAVVALRNGADIYAVSKMLSHKLLSTTQSNYLNNDTEQATEAQDTFSAVISSSDDAIDVEIIEDEYEILKKLYPHASDEKIYKIIEMMK
ncbi:tyrosine-type recombinase/integrase [Sulfurimonas sp.]|uniref:tyrosine-type recombinase/integrase n=1 Tax=Sulfurimonas sp. TaxID=2022749 RepID=UPI003565CF5E